MKNVISILFVLLSFGALSHKFYISIADMEWDAEHSRLKVSLKLVGHDFEQVLERKFGFPVVLEEIADSSEVGTYIQQYLRHNFKVSSSNENCQLNYLGKEVNSKDEAYFYMTFTNVLNPAAVKITNKLLFSLSDQQQNIVHYTYLGRTKSLTLLPSVSYGELNFDE